MGLKQAKRHGFLLTNWRRVFLRVLVVAGCALVAGWVLQQAVAASERQEGEAGFGQGMLHGALMPCALPHLLLGHDVRIIAERTTGRTYKLGYTVGVNGCGAVFFGLFFWRVSRWRNRFSRGANQADHSVPDDLSAQETSDERAPNAI